MIPKHETKRVHARAREQNSEDQLASHLRAFLEKDLSEKETNSFAQLLNTFVQSLARKCCNLQAADRSDITQQVLREMLAGGLRRSRRMQAHVENGATNEQLLATLRAQTRERLMARTVDCVRRSKARRTVPLESAPPWALECEPFQPPGFPEVEEVLAALSVGEICGQARPKDRELVRELIAHGMTMTEFAACRGMGVPAVSKAVARVRPYLRAEFDLKP